MQPFLAKDAAASQVVGQDLYRDRFAAGNRGGNRGDTAREDEFLDQAVRDGDRAREKGAQGFAERPHIPRGFYRRLL